MVKAMAFKYDGYNNLYLPVPRPHRYGHKDGEGYVFVDVDLLARAFCDCNTPEDRVRFMEAFLRESLGDRIIELEPLLDIGTPRD